jgi:hypothetical protein
MPPHLWWTLLFALQLYLSERPWAGLRPVQIILKKSQYKALAERCMATDYKSRPTFTEVCTRCRCALTSRTSSCILDARCPCPTLPRGSVHQGHDVMYGGLAGYLLSSRIEYAH